MIFPGFVTDGMSGLVMRLLFVSECVYEVGFHFSNNVYVYIRFTFRGNSWNSESSGGLETPIMDPTNAFDGIV